MSVSVVAVSSNGMTADLSNSPGSVTEARHFVRDDLSNRGLPRLVVDDVLVVVSELMGNAVRHARPLDGDGGTPDGTGSVRLRWVVTDAEVRIDVTDGGGAFRPHVAPPSLNSTGGRGLAIVSALARDWGVVSSTGVVTVYAIVAR